MEIELFELKTEKEKRNLAVKKWMAENKDYWREYQLHAYHRKMQDPVKRAEINRKARERYARLAQERKKANPKTCDGRGKRRFPEGYDGSLFRNPKRKPRTATTTTTTITDDTDYYEKFT